MDRWKSIYSSFKEAENYSINCKRCKTKNTHAFVYGKITAHLVGVRNGDKEEFNFVKCSTCGAYSVEYLYYKAIDREKSVSTTDGSAKLPTHKLEKKIISSHNNF